MSLRIIERLQTVWGAIRARWDGGAYNLVVTNVTQNEADAFEMLDPARWTLEPGAGDLVFVDGNARGASYLVIAKSPYDAGQQTVLTQVGTWPMDNRIDAFVHLSQRSPAQTGVVEAVSADELDDLPTVPAYAPRTGCTLSQATTTLTIDFTAPHDLSTDDRIEVYDATDPRVAYPDLIVATVPTPLRVTCTHQQGAALPSVTVASATGTVAKRPVMDGARNGVVLEFGPGSATQAAVYVRAEAGEALPTGTAGQAHVVTVGSTASVPTAAGTGRRAFRATSRYVLTMTRQKVAIDDKPVNSTTVASSRVAIDNVLPNPKRRFRTRIRARGSAALTRPVARIVSAAKAGSSTVTIVTDRPHGLTTASVVGVTGIRDQTNFAATAGLTVASVVDANTFTVAIGSSATATSRGGTVWLQNGGVTPTVQGQIAQSVQSIARTGDLVTLVGSATWAGLSIGDTIDLHGVRSNADGSDLGFDGAYRVHDFATSTLTAQIIPAAAVTAGTPAAPAGGDIATTDCGGTVIKRTEIRIDRIRWSPWSPVVAEIIGSGLARADGGDAVPVVTQGNVTINSPTLAASTNLAADVGVQYRGTATGGGTPTNVNAPATPAAQSVKGSAGKITSYDLTNTAGTPRYVKVFNTAGAVTMGTTAAQFEIALPANSTKALAPAGGISMTAGIQIAVTGGRGTTDNTAITAGDVTGHIEFA